MYFGFGSHRHYSQRKKYSRCTSYIGLHEIFLVSENGSFNIETGLGHEAKLNFSVICQIYTYLKKY